MTTIHNTPSWMSTNKRLSIKMIMLTKESDNLRSKIFENQSMVAQERAKSKPNNNKKNNHGLCRRSSINTWKESKSSVMHSEKLILQESKKKHQSWYLSKQEIMRRLDALGRNVMKLKLSLHIIQETNMQLQLGGPLANKSISNTDEGKKARRHCESAIEAYERQFDSLQHSLSEESIALDDQRIQLERDILNAINNNTDTFFEEEQAEIR